MKDAVTYWQERAEKAETERDELKRRVEEENRQGMYWYELYTEFVEQHGDPKDMAQKLEKAEAERDSLKTKVKKLERALLGHYGPNLTTDRLLKEMEQ